MNNNELLTRINIDTKIMGGKPTIKGTRLTVQYILELLAQGLTINDILGEYQTLKAEDIFACLQLQA